MKQTKVLLMLCLSSPFRYVTGKIAAATRRQNNKRSNIIKTSKKGSLRDQLYTRISLLGHPHLSVTPLLDQWVSECRTVNDSQMRFLIRELRHKRRFIHALEVSKWMSKERSKLVSAADIAVRLDLIAKVHGVQAAEYYFKKISEELRTLEVHSALLECFARAKCIYKAEGIMQMMRDLRFPLCSLPHNVMLNLYWQTGNREKLDAMLNEMEANKLKFDNFTYSILLNAFGGDCDIDGVERIVTKMESDPDHVEWKAYAIAAKQFLKAQLIDKALESLRKSENLVALSRRKSEAYSSIIILYAIAGKKAEVLRVWEECKECKVTNRNYMSVLPSVLKFDDMETAEKVFNEWRNSNLLKDIRIPNFLISAYCEKGMVEKAEALLETVHSKQWQKPDSFTWYWMSYGYVKSNQMAKAVEAVESALSQSNPQVYWKAQHETLAACIKYLEDKGELERLNALIDSLKDKCAISAKIHDNLIDYFSCKCDLEDVFEGNEVEERESSKDTTHTSLRVWF